jgi:hypothetical protein
MTRSGRPGRAGFARGAALALSLFLGQAAGAQTLAVDAGDHADFTRLVIRIGPDRDWQLEEVDGTWRLSLSPGIERFDLTGSFDLIQRRRVADLSQEGETLVIALDCDCDVTAFRYRDAFLVVDVSDPDPAAAPATQEASGGDAERSVMVDSDVGRTSSPAPLYGSGTNNPGSAGFPEPRAATAGQIAAAALPDLARLLTPGPTPPRQPSEQLPVPPQPETPALNPVESPRPDLEEAAQIMAEQLARAAAAGLLEPAAGTPLDFADPLPGRMPSASGADAPRNTAEGTPPDPLTTAPAQPVTAPTIDAAPESLPPADPPILARNAFDIATAPLPDASPVQPRLECVGRVHPLADSLTRPGEDQAEEPGLGALRQAVFDERDRLVEDAVLRLANYYLQRGFGAEAVFWLTRLDDPPDDLVALGKMVDGLEAPQFPRVSDPSACSDQELVFRYLGGAMQAPSPRRKHAASSRVSRPCPISCSGNSARRSRGGCSTKGMPVRRATCATCSASPGSCPKRRC